MNSQFGDPRAYRPSMESKAKLLGHPAHPILVTFPLGLLATSVAFDLGGKLINKRELVSSGFWMALSGSATGIIAAIPGIVDYLAIPSGTRARRIGFLHGLGNAVVLGLFAGSLALRAPGSGKPSAGSTTLSVAGLLVALGTGWLGGELVDRLGVGVDDNASLDAPNSLSRERVVRP